MALKRRRINTSIFSVCRAQVRLWPEQIPANKPLRAHLGLPAQDPRICSMAKRYHWPPAWAALTPVSHCKRKQGVSGAEAVRMQSRSSARPLPFHTGSVRSARLNSVFCTKWANSNLILNKIGLDLLLE